MEAGKSTQGSPAIDKVNQDTEYGGDDRQENEYGGQDKKERARAWMKTTKSKNEATQQRRRLNSHTAFGMTTAAVRS
jgi:hypothetical protein